MGVDSRIRAWRRVEKIARRLRSEKGCEWDRAQTPESLAPYLIEEVHEALEALAQGPPEKLTEEIGDALFLWIFFLQLLEDSGRVSIEDASRAIEAKLIRRHPHVFDGAGRGGSQDSGGSTPAAWEIGKLRESEVPRETLTPLPAGIPALLKARRIQEKAAAFGFDWNEAREVMPKVREEIDELDVEIAMNPRSAAVREELGDLLFALVNLSRHLGEDPEAALQTATEKFRRRFNAMAKSIEAAGHQIGDTPLDLMENHWNSVKSSEASASPPEDRP